MWLWGNPPRQGLLTAEGQRGKKGERVTGNADTMSKRRNRIFVPLSAAGNG
jgi:hypothetical protein